VTRILNQRVTRERLFTAAFDDVIVATGVHPRQPDIPGIGCANVVSYLDVLLGRAVVGPRVAVMGAGGIGVDVSLFLLHNASEALPLSTPAWMAEWGVDLSARTAGGLIPPTPPVLTRRLYLLQRKTGKVGTGLGKTSGWVHRAGLHRHHVEMLSGVMYQKIDKAGLHITIDQQARLLEVDTVVVCAGQESIRELMPVAPIHPHIGPRFHLIGGAALATELDAKRAIREGAELAARL
jgi:2,4-dienoyl-CoA reductase (NADPH2)